RGRAAVPRWLTLHPARLRAFLPLSVWKGSPMSSPCSPMLPLNDGRQIPQLGFGLWQVPADITAATTAAGLKLGYRLVDGAAAYRNEEGQGQGVRDSGLPRDQVFVTTKIWNSDQ